MNYRSLGNLFGIGKSTAWTITTQVCTCIVERLLPNYIRLPRVDEVQEEIDGFHKIAGFPQAVGAVDGCHISTSPPNENRDDYINRKQFYSIILQALVDSDYFFRDVYIGWPGRVHDARVFKNSPLYDACSAQSFLPRNLSKRFNGTVVPPVIIGDSAYGLSNFLMRPYVDRGHLTQSELEFNNCLSKTRVVVENAFGRLKGRFRCLGKRLELSIPNCCVISSACCVLHNYCESMKEAFNDEWLIGVDIHADIPQCDRRTRNDQQAEAIRTAIQLYLS